MSFETPHYSVGDLLAWAASGHLQLPDFQRDYKWDDERIRSLLVTIVRGHPMGVVMVLETGGQNVRFKPRPITGVQGTVGEPGLLLLDGQQRTTSLFQALSGDGVVDTEDDRRKKLRRKYYLDIEQAVGTTQDRDAAVISLPHDGLVTENFGRDVVLDVSTPEKEQQLGLMPMTAPFAPGGAMTWLLGYLSAGGEGDAARRQELMQQLNQQVLLPLTSYRIPAIKLGQGTTKDAVATVFEKVNTGGLPLNVFELLTATFAGDRPYYDEHGTDFRLGEDWAATCAVRDKYPVLSGLGATDFLQGVSILATLNQRRQDIAAGKPKPTATSARKDDILNLDLRDYLRWADELRGALPWVAHFLKAEHFHTAGALAYRSQLVSLAVLRAIIGDDIDLYAVRSRIRQWFWCGVLGELYGSTIETKIARDAEQVPDWALAAKDGTTAPQPDTVARASFAETRLLSMRTRGSAAYKGVYALLMAQPTPCVDWKFHKVIDQATYEDLQVDIHHVFPHKWCLDNGIDPSYRESIINKTPLAKKTNIQLGGVSPKQYMGRLDSNGISPAAVDEIIRSHAIDPATLRAGDFDAYFNARRKALVELIEAAMGKPVNRDWDDDVDDTEAPHAFAEELDEAEGDVSADLEYADTEGT